MAIESFLLESNPMTSVSINNTTKEVVLSQGLMGRNAPVILLTAQQFVEVINLCKGRILTKLTYEALSVVHAIDQVKASIESKQDFLNHLTRDCGELLEFLDEFPSIIERREKQEIAALFRACIVMALSCVNDRTPSGEGHGDSRESPQSE
jgi:hypothetical protein